MSESLFGYLVNRFSSSPENLATEALNFILNRSSVARGAFTHLLDHLGISLPENLAYQTQDADSEDGAIPDLVAKDSRGRAVLLGEAKFWAGLTDNQPVTYLQRLNKTGGKALIFFAPSKRFPTLWAELIRRCQDAGIELVEVMGELSGIRVAKVQDTQHLVLLSWRVMLDTLRQSLEVEGEREMIANLIQLQGLCDQMDNSAFLPLRSEELTSTTGMRINQFCDLIDEITEMLVAQGLASVTGTRATPTRTGYLRYMHFQKHACSFEFNPLLWDKYRSTPLWLGIKSHDWKYDPEARKRLVSYELAQPSQLFRENEYIYIPLYLRTRVEKAEVVKGLADQIHRILEHLSGEGQQE
jgi:hypothetical protein